MTCENLDGQCANSWCNCDQVRARKASSARTPSEPQGACERSRLATCSLPVSSALRLAAAWEDRAHMADLAWEQEADPAWAAKAEAYRLCARQLRTEATYAPERQPEENVKDEPRRKPSTESKP